MPCRKWWSCVGLWLIGLAAFAGCVGHEQGNDTDASWEGVCVDKDHDGYGFQCVKGDDCNDDDPSEHNDCTACTTPDEGCACAASSAPVSCSLPLSLTSSGMLLCRTGTRYCRDGTWTGCEGLTEFEAPAPSQLQRQAYINQDAAPVGCGDPCDPDCYRVTDTLPTTATDAGVGNNTTVRDGGGITISLSNDYLAVDAGVYDAGLLDQDRSSCVPGTAPDRDCDGIPDAYDPYPDAPPFVSGHDTIFMALAPGQSGTQALDLTFFLNSADVYFYLDMTASMEGERDNLISSLTSGNYLPNSGSGMNCADRDFDGNPDNTLKTGGIAGNIACLIRDSRLGAGWFRDIPFVGPYAGGGNITVAPTTFVMFENRQDITSDVSKVLTALQGFQTDGNYNVPEGSMQGLWALATGQELYAGWNRAGIPARSGCTGGTWGYPCFRSSAVPIIIHITDAPLQNGPSPTASDKVGYLNDCKSSEKTNCVAQTCSQTTQTCTQSVQTCTQTGQVCTQYASTGTCTGGLLGLGNGSSCSASKSCSWGGTCSYPCSQYTTQCTQYTTTCTQYTTTCSKYTCTQYACVDNAPDRNPLNYDSSVLAGMNSGTTKHYLPLTASAETLATAQNVGTIDGVLVTYFGNTETMSSDMTYANSTYSGSCTSGSAWSSKNQSANDAVFKFTVNSTTTTYTISTRGSHFDTTLMVRPATVDKNSKIQCSDDIGGTDNSNGNIGGGDNSEIVTKFSAKGDYYAIVKGAGSGNNGWFQITFGDASKQTTEQFVPQLWLGPNGDGNNGIRSALLSQGIRVITVNSSTDAYLADQAAVLSTTTGAVSSSGSPLEFQISSDGTGMGTAVIDAVNLLAGNLSMDVGVSLLQSPDKPPVPFGFLVQAIDLPGDSCDAPVDTDGDPQHLPDTQKNCRPGATPRFQITFTNPPAPNNVPLNPADTKNGGYNMTLQLIGDEQYVVDTMPVYIVPQAIVPVPQIRLYQQTGTYEQRITAKGCAGNETPLWRTLTWDGTLPAGTDVAWQICGGNSDSDLDTCTLLDVADIKPGNACSTQSDCPNGYCDSSGVCYFATGASCSAASDCGSSSSALCVSGSCRWTDSDGTIDLQPLSKSLQGRSHVRVRAVLTANSSRTSAPTVKNWNVTYVCTADE
jgi:hypothetical protein